MSSPVARVGDLFVGMCGCCPSGMSGTIVTGAATSESDGMPIARVGDLAIGFCGHVSVVSSGSAIYDIESSQVARVGDIVSGCIVGVIVTGSDKHDSD